MLYGANGYTGRLIAEEAVRRGMTLTLAGRNARAVEPLADSLRCLRRVFSLEDRGQIAAQLAGLRAVLHCAGPFSATAEPMMDACLKAGVHYLDITGEIAVIEAAARRSPAAQAAGVTLLPAVGFDVVPSDCLAAMLAQRLPGATLLQLAFLGLQAVSPGTAKTMLEGLAEGGRARLDGRIVHVPVAWKTMEIPFREGRQSAVTIPWGDVASAWHSTGIPNIEVYMGALPAQIRWLRRARFLLAALRLALVRRALRGGVRWFVAGPSADQRRASRGSFWGRVSDPSGKRIEATLQTASGYELTVRTALACLAKVLAGACPPGFLTPSKAFGAEFILAIPDADLRWHE
jgi:short subunit dehydrogenase-like uncharacterized protein